MATETMLERDVRQEEVVDKGSGYNYGRKWTYLGNGKSYETVLTKYLDTSDILQRGRRLDSWLSVHFLQSLRLGAVSKY